MRTNTPRNELHNKYWTTSYPTVATLPMAAIVQAVANLDFKKIRVPALFYYSLNDKVVNPEATGDVARQWGGKTKTINVIMTKEDDVYSHIIAGDIVSPKQTSYAVRQMVKWIKNMAHFH
ncbi:MAG: alpha/beta hydrolase, partial [Pseudomonadota bacterium]|nr:alpha/beta hydrolase [Pseudomonadota bacterium]